MGIFSKNKKPEPNEAWNKLLELLQVVQTELASIKVKQEAFDTKLKGLEIRYGRLMRQIQEEEEAEEENEPEDNSLKGLPFSR